MFDDPRPILWIDGTALIRCAAYENESLDQGRYSRQLSSFAELLQEVSNGASPRGITIRPARQMAQETLIQKIRSLPPERVAEVEDFVDFLTVRDQDRRLTQAATRMSEDAFRAVWDNADDAEYDSL
jgi:hypothetical protein